ncbi:hypothetical protein MMC06_000338 [Schaereria dolodes]|nr:hypothetical protein [Schaereria dolodes]
MEESNSNEVYLISIFNVSAAIKPLADRWQIVISIKLSLVWILGVWTSVSAHIKTALLENGPVIWQDQNPERPKWARHARHHLVITRRTTDLRQSLKCRKLLLAGDVFDLPIANIVYEAEPT